MTGRAGMTEEQHARHVEDRVTYQRNYKQRFGSYEKVVDQETGKPHLIFTMGSWTGQSSTT